MGVRCELYPDSAKPAKQFQHAAKRGIPYAVLCGSQEIELGVFGLKDLSSGEQSQCTLQQLAGILKN